MSDRRSAEIGVEIPNNFNGIFYVTQVGSNAPSHNGRQTGKPIGIIFDENKNSEDDVRATVRGILWNENETEFKERKLAPGVEHPRAYKAIDMRETTAKGIEINW